MVIYITRGGAVSLTVRSVILQLLENRIPFYGWEEQKLPDAVPDNLDDFDAAIIDEEILREASPEMRAKLEQYAREKYICIIPASYERGPMSLTEQMLEVDLNMFAAGAHLGPEELPPLADEVIISGFIERAIDFWENDTFECINEYHLHFIEGALALEKSCYAPENWSARIDAAFERVYDLLTPDGDHDQLCGASLMNIYAQRCKRPGAQEKMFKIIDRILQTRPRTPEGILAMGGNMDDPLFFSGLDTPMFGRNSFTVAGRDMVTNEIFHFYGGVFAACAQAGRRELLEENLRLMRHIDTVHRDSDGLFFHASRKGEVIGEKWGRGNTHALLGAFYMLRRYPDMAEDIRNEVLRFIDRSGKALAAVQQKSGLWRNVLNNPATPEEVSCTVLITCIYSWCVNRGWLSEDYIPMLLRSRDALKRRFWHGYGTANCVGSFPAYRHPEFYMRRRFHGAVMPLIVPALLETAELEKRITGSGERR